MIKKLSTSRENILEYEVDDKLTEEENVRVIDEIKVVLRKFGKARLLVKAEKMPQIELSAIDDRLKFAKDHLDQIEKYALVTDSDLAEYISKVSDKVVKVDIRQFAVDEEEMARSWIRES